MSASRTLRRMNPRNRQEMYEGETVDYRRLKPGSVNRRILWERRDGELLRSYHATKGHRCVRSPE